ncbi:MAG: cupin domain-containing protein [Prolixibacteraceae bacterium]|jgi:quercetin dioxygenase-like cupin family protein|nr:cupin domain-containing protein [Prolixibacteraceae bacterium]
MRIVSLAELNPREGNKPNVELLLNTGHSKEIKISFTKGQTMAEHKAPGAIVVMVYTGKIQFGVNGKQHILNRGDMISLEPQIAHDLEALEDSIVRLSLSSHDDFTRVQMLTK